MSLPAKSRSSFSVLRIFEAWLVLGTLIGLFQQLFDGCPQDVFDSYRESTHWFFEFHLTEKSKHSTSSLGSYALCSDL